MALRAILGNSISAKLADLLRDTKFRGKLRLLETITPATGQRACSVFGCRMTLDLAEYNQRRAYFGCHEEAEIRMLQKWLRPGMVVVDVGANLGYHTALFASAVGKDGLVLSVEPTPPVFARLKAMVDENHLSQVRNLNAGLSDKTGSLQLNVLSSATNFSATAAALSEGEAFEVPTRTLDDVLDEAGIQSVDLLKLDAMGHEPFILRGARRSLSQRRIKAVFCEFYWWWLQEQGESVESLWRLLIDAGFVDRTGQPPPAAGANSIRLVELAS